jgi:aspartate/methionine/tyrosine aminotransferase
VVGTKEALFLIATAATDADGKGGRRPAVLMPNPVYSVYQGAAALAGADPIFLPATAASGFLPDLDSLDEADLARTAVCYVCSPANPQGAVADLAYLAKPCASPARTTSSSWSTNATPRSMTTRPRRAPSKPRRRWAAPSIT